MDTSIPLSPFDYLSGMGLLRSQLSGKLQFHLMKNKCTRRLKCVFILTHNKTETKLFTPPLLLQPSWKPHVVEKHSPIKSCTEAETAVRALRCYAEPNFKTILQIQLKSFCCKGDCPSYKVLSFHEQVGMCLFFLFPQILTQIPNTQFSNILPM